MEDLTVEKYYGVYSLDSVFRCPKNEKHHMTVGDFTCFNCGCSYGSYGHFDNRYICHCGRPDKFLIKAREICSEVEGDNQT